MYYKLVIVWVAAALMWAPVMVVNAVEETVEIDSNSGEITAIYAKNNGAWLPEVIESTKLCLDNQTVQEVRNDGTVICYDTATGSFTSYLNIEIKFEKPATSLKARKVIENVSPCPPDSALVKQIGDDSIECEPL